MSSSENILNTDDNHAPEAASDARLTSQKHGIRITLLVLVAFIALVLALFVKKVTTPRVLSATELRVNGAFQFPNPRIISPFELTDQYGQSFGLENFQDRWSLVFFGFTQCPDICPTTLATLSRWFDQLNPTLREKTQVVMVSLDPERDKTDTLKQYMSYFSPEFIGLTGEFLTTKRFANQLNIAFTKVILDSETQLDYTIDHGAAVALINPKGHFHAFFKSPLDTSQLKLTFESIVTSF